MLDPMEERENALGHGSTRQRCRAHARSGKRCKRFPIPGGTVCVMHGGAAPQVAAAARGRLQDAYARHCLWQISRSDSDVSVLFDNYREPALRVRLAARHLKELRKRAPRWWVRIDDDTRWRLERERRR